MKFGLNDHVLEKIKAVLAQFPEVEHVVIFGSRAKGQHRSGSDIDIAIYGNGVSESPAIDINAILKEREPLPYYFDIISYPSLKNSDLKDHIGRIGKIFYNNNYSN